MKKIVHLSSAHPAQDTRILHRECRSLAEAGYEVVLIANSAQDFEEHGVRVRALTSGSINRAKRMTSQVLRVFKMAREERADLYHFHDPELIPVGILLRVLGKPVIFDVHESTSKLVYSKDWIPLPLRTMVATGYRLIERVSGFFLSAFVAATPAIAEQLPAKKTTIVQNFPVISELLPDGIPERDFSRRKVVYVGGIEVARGAKGMVAAMAELPDSPSTTLTLAGTVRPESLKQELQSMRGGEHTQFAGLLNRKQVSDLLSEASVGLVVLHPEPNYVDSYPVKMFEYMACGLPIVASNFPFWKQFVVDTGAGIMVDPLDPLDIATAVNTILNDSDMAESMGKAGVRAVAERFNWDSESRKLIALVEQLVGVATSGNGSAR